MGKKQRDSRGAKAISAGLEALRLAEVRKLAEAQALRDRILREREAAASRPARTLPRPQVPSPLSHSFSLMADTLDPRRLAQLASLPFAVSSEPGDHRRVFHRAGADARLAAWLRPEQQANALYVVVRWHTERDYGWLDVLGAFRTRSRALAVARAACDKRDGEQGYDSDEDDGSGEEEVGVRGTGCRRRAVHSRHGSVLLSSKVAAAWDVLPVACDPPLPPSFAVAGANIIDSKVLAASAAVCGADFRARCRTALLCFNRLSGGRMRSHLSLPILVLLSAHHEHAQRVSLLVEARWCFDIARQVDVHLAVPSALPAAVAAMRAAVSTWARKPDESLCLRAPGWANWDVLLPKEPASECRPPRRAALHGHSQLSAEADLSDTLNQRWYQGRHRAVRPALGVVPRVPVDVVLGTVWTADASAAAAQGRHSPIRRSALGRSARMTWDGVATGPPLCHIYDLLSPAEAVLVRERVCPACGISCEANTCTVQRRRLATCLNCYCHWPPPDAPPLARGWYPSADQRRKDLSYQGPCTSCGALIKAPGEEPPAPGEQMLCIDCGGHLERAESRDHSLRPGGESLLEGAPVLRPPPGWAEATGAVLGGVGRSDAEGPAEASRARRAGRLAAGVWRRPRVVRCVR